MKKQGRKYLGSRRAKIIDRHYSRSRAEGIRVYDSLLKKLEAGLSGASSFNWIETGWNPPAPKYLVEHVHGVLLSSRLVGKALLWRDAHQRGFFEWAEKREVSGLAERAAALKFTDWTEAPIAADSEAWRWFRKKIPMTADEFKAASRSAQAAAFTIANTENLNLVKAAKGLVEEAVRGQMTKHEFMKAAKDAWSVLGVTKAAPWHLETVYLTNIHSAANAARWNELQRDTAGLRNFFPSLQFLTVGDQACDICAPLDGQVHPRDDGFWSTYYPPLHHRCKCQVIEVSVLDNVRPTELPGGLLPPAPGFDRPPAQFAAADLIYKLVA